MAIGTMTNKNDPIFAAIAEHYAAYRYWDAKLTQRGWVEGKPAYKAANREAWGAEDVEIDALWKMIAIVPTTPEGMLAFETHMSEHGLWELLERKRAA